jgi:hypothetical protein
VKFCRDDLVASKAPDNSKLGFGVGLSMRFARSELSQPKASQESVRHESG